MGFQLGDSIYPPQNLFVGLSDCCANSKKISASSDAKRWYCQLQLNASQPSCCVALFTTRKNTWKRGFRGRSPLSAACAKRMLHLLKNNTFLISENSSFQPLILTRRVHNWHSSLLTLLNPTTNHNWDASDAVIAPALITFLASKTALKKQLHCDFFRLKSLPLLL